MIATDGLLDLTIVLKKTILTRQSDRFGYKLA
jgi:hypothetical protein